MTTAIHVAGPLEGLVQRCSRCGAILNDYTNAMVPEGSGRLNGFAEGAHVEVQRHEWFGSSTVTAEPADCERLPRGK